MKKKWLSGLSALALAAAPAPLWAQSQLPVPAAEPEQSALDDAIAIIEASGFDRQIDFMMQGLAPILSNSLIGSIEGANDGPALLAKIDENFKGGRAEFAKIYTARVLAEFKGQYPAMRLAAAKVYAAALSPGDLKDIRVFMESSAGRNMVARLPIIQADMAKIGSATGKEIGESIFLEMIGSMRNSDVADGTSAS